MPTLHTGCLPYCCSLLRYHGKYALHFVVGSNVSSQLKDTYAREISSKQLFLIDANIREKQSKDPWGIAAEVSQNSKQII